MLYLWNHLFVVSINFRIRLVTHRMPCVTLKVLQYMSRFALGMLQCMSFVALGVLQWMPLVSLGVLHWMSCVARGALQWMSCAALTLRCVLLNAGMTRSTSVRRDNRYCDATPDLRGDIQMNRNYAVANIMCRVYSTKYRCKYWVLCRDVVCRVAMRVCRVSGQMSCVAMSEVTLPCHVDKTDPTKEMAVSNEPHAHTCTV